MSEGHRKPNFFQTISILFQLAMKRMQKIAIDSIPKGSIIDIGGGGAGIIAQIGKERVTSIDKNQREIDEAKHKAPEATWVLADAKNLDFSDEQFDNATAFFSIMYMSNEDKKEVFKETYKVISQEGELWIWDAPISKEKGAFLIKIKVIFPDKTVVRTGYGVLSKIQTVDVTKKMLEDVGFRVEIIESNRQWYFLKAKK